MRNAPKNLKDKLLHSTPDFSLIKITFNIPLANFGKLKHVGMNYITTNNVAYFQPF